MSKYSLPLRPFILASPPFDVKKAKRRITLCICATRQYYMYSRIQALFDLTILSCIDAKIPYEYTPNISK